MVAGGAIKSQFYRPLGTIKSGLYRAELQSFMVRFSIEISKKKQDPNPYRNYGAHMAPYTFAVGRVPSEIFLGPTGSKTFASGQAPHTIGIGGHMAPITFIRLWVLKCFGRIFFGADWFQKFCVRSGAPYDRYRAPYGPYNFYDALGPEMFWANIFWARSSPKLCHPKTFRTQSLIKM